MSLYILWSQCYWQIQKSKALHRKSSTFFYVVFNLFPLTFNHFVHWAITANRVGFLYIRALHNASYTFFWQLVLLIFICTGCYSCLVALVSMTFHCNLLPDIWKNLKLFTLLFAIQLFNLSTHIQLCFSSLVFSQKTLISLFCLCW